jgi:hypothetical protein
MVRLILRWGAILGAILLLCACSQQWRTTVKADGSGTLDWELQMTEQEVGQLTGSGFGINNPYDTPQEVCDYLLGNHLNAVTEGQSDFEMIGEQRGADTLCRLSTQFDSVAELRDLLEEEGFVVHDVSFEGGNFNYDISVNLEDVGGGFLTDAPSAQTWWYVVPPGRVVEDNADRKDGSALGWNLEPGQVTRLTLRSTVSSSVVSLPSGLSLPIGLLALCCCSAILVVGGSVVAITRRRGKSSVPVT